jgi:uncharacterized protein YkwD
MRRSTSLTLACLILTTWTTSGFAGDGPFSRLAARFGRVGAAPVHAVQRVLTTSQPAYAQPQADAAPAPEATSPGGDPYGFAGIINRLRSAAGLHPLQYDPGLSSWASRNNAAQAWRGIGHHVNPNCYQNCGYNYSNANDAANGWLNSPGHRQNMLSSSVSSFGIAYGPGPYWTLNLR